MIKTCIITTSFPRQKKSYAGIFVKNFIESFSKNIVFSIVAPSDKKNVDLPPETYNVKWVRYSPRKWETLFYNGGGIPQNLDFPLFTYFKFLFFLTSMTITSFIQSFKNDIVHVQWLQNGIFAILPKLILRKKVVITIHGSDFKLFTSSRFHKIVGKIIFFFSDAVITVNKEFKERLSAEYPNKNIYYMPYGYKINGSRDKNKESNTLLFVGSLTKAKGLLDLMHVMDKLIKMGIKAKLKIIGEGMLFSHLEKWSKKHDGNSIQLLGAMENNEVVQEMQNCKLLILPSYSEGRPTVVMEAMSNGLPIIATKLSGIEEVVRDGVNGKLFTPGRKDVMFKILKDAFQGKLPLDLFVTNSFKLLKLEKLTVDNMVESHTALYQSLLKKNND